MEYTRGLSNQEAANEAATFQPDYVKLKWHNGIAHGARKYINDIGPCDAEKTTFGENLFETIVPDYVNHYGDLNGVVYVGATHNAKGIVSDLLLNHQFTDDMKSSKYSDIGVACACNPSKELSCAIVFGSNVSETDEDKIISPMDHVDNKSQCEALCGKY